MAAVLPSSEAPSSAAFLQVLHDMGPKDNPKWADWNNINTFCKRCQEIDWQPVQIYLSIADGYTYFPKVPLYPCQPKLRDIREAAHAGCHLCTIVLTCITTTIYRAAIGVDPIGTSLDRIDGDCSVKVDSDAQRAHSPVNINVTLEDSASNVVGWLILSLPVVGSEDELRRYRATALDIVQYPTPWLALVSFLSSSEQIGRYWFDDCTANHGSACQQDVEQLPTRVIDVSSRADPFLFVTNGISGHYATLSYCWGEAPVLTTTTTNFDARKAAIPLTSFPPTLRDALWWTRQLGLRFIWIDALCIIQDSVSDLELELSKMADVYKNSTVTIAATAAKDVSAGCVPRRSKLSLAPCCPREGVVIQPDYGRGTWIHQKGPLESRAWTFQEVRLSQRVLRCGGEELAWQCRHCKRREGDPVAEIIHHSQDTGTFFGTRALDDGKRLKRTDSALTLYYQMVSQFLVRRLSYSRDRLPAFSGMANHFAGIFRVLDDENTQDPETSCSLKPRYLAGLWEFDLLRGLCWRALDPGPYVPYRAPSWSWAAFESIIIYNKTMPQQRRFLAEILDVAVHVPGLNPYGNVTSGTLVLLAPVTLLPSHIYGDDSDVGLWKWNFPLLRWDHEGAASPGSICLRIELSWCLILAPLDQLHFRGVYRRIGTVVSLNEMDASAESKGQGLDLLDWRTEVVTIV